MINIKNFRKENSDLANVWDFNNSHTLSSNTKSGMFYFDTFNEALKALKYGWEDGRCQLESKVKELNLKTNETKKIKYEYNVVGGKVQ